MKKLLIILVTSCLVNYSFAKENSIKEHPKTIDIDNISTKGLDRNVSKVFKQTHKLIQQARKQKDAQTEMAASKQWCLLLHNFDFLSQAQDCYYIIGMDDKTNAKWPYLYAKASAKMGDFEQAQIGFKETIRRDSVYLPAHYYQIQQSLSDNNLATAFSQFAQVPANLRLTSVLLNLSGDLYFAVENYHVAIGFYQQALQLVPKAKSLNYKIARAYQALDMMQQAESFIKLSDATKIRLIDPYYQEVKSTTIGEIPYLIKAKTALVNGDSKSAIKSYKKALDYNPKSEGALVNIAVAYFQDKQTEKAKEFFIKSLKINPKQEKSLYNLATIAVSEGDIAASQDYFEQYKAIDETDINVNYQLAQIYYQQGQFDKVKEIAQLKSMNAHIETQYLKAKAYIQLEQYFDAINWLNEINENVPGNYKVLLALAKLESQVPDLQLRNAELSLKHATQAYNLNKNAQSYWQFIVALDENKKCKQLNITIADLSKLLKVETKLAYERLIKQRGNDLKCK